VWYGLSRHQAEAVMFMTQRFNYEGSRTFALMNWAEFGAPLQADITIALLQFAGKLRVKS
jgi:hypothetical protein